MDLPVEVAQVQPGHQVARLRIRPTRAPGGRGGGGAVLADLGILARRQAMAAADPPGSRRDFEQPLPGVVGSAARASGGERGPLGSASGAGRRLDQQRRRGLPEPVGPAIVHGDPVSQVEQQFRQTPAARARALHPVGPVPVAPHFADIERGDEPAAEVPAEGQHRRPFTGLPQVDIPHDRRTGERVAADQAHLPIGGAGGVTRGEFAQDHAAEAGPGMPVVDPAVPLFRSRAEDVRRDEGEEFFAGVGGEGMEHPAAGRQVHHRPAVHPAFEEPAVRGPLAGDRVRMARRTSRSHRARQTLAEFPGPDAAREVRPPVGLVDRAGFRVDRDPLAADQPDRHLGGVGGVPRPVPVEFAQEAVLHPEVGGGDRSDFETAKTGLPCAVEQDQPAGRVAPFEPGAGVPDHRRAGAVRFGVPVRRGRRGRRGAAVHRMGDEPAPQPAQVRAGGEEHIVRVAAAKPEDLGQLLRLARVRHQRVPRPGRIRSGEGVRRAARHQFLHRGEAGGAHLHFPFRQGHRPQHFVEGFREGLGAGRVVGRPSEVGSHPRQVVGEAAFPAPAAAEADDVDVADPRVRVPVVQGVEGRLGLEPGVHAGEFVPPGAARGVGLRGPVAPPERGAPGGEPLRRRGEGVAPVPVVAFAGVHPVREQQDDVLLARFEVGDRLVADVRRELAQADAVRGDVGVRGGRELREGLGAGGGGVAAGGRGPERHAGAGGVAPDRGAGRRPRREADPAGGVGAGGLHRRLRGPVPAVRPEGGDAPVDERLAGLGHQGADGVFQRLPRHGVAGAAADADLHRGRGVEQDPDAGPGVAPDQAQRVPSALDRQRGVGRRGGRRRRRGANAGAAAGRSRDREDQRGGGPESHGGVLALQRIRRTPPPLPCPQLVRSSA